MDKIEKKIYSEWAFTENQFLKRDMNMLIYDELKSKYKISRSVKDADNSEFDVVFTIKPEYNRNVVTIHRNKASLSRTELALLADSGNLCFGFTRSGIIEVFTD